MISVFNYINYGLTALSVIAFIVLIIVKKKSHSGDFVRFCKNISDFTANVESINEDNLTQFEVACLKSCKYDGITEGWKAFKNARFDYPSTYFDNEKCLMIDNKQNTKLSWVVFSVLFAISLLLTVVSYFVLNKFINSYALYVIPWFLVILLLNSSNSKTKIAFDQMLEDLDVSVSLQKYRDYQFDLSGLEPTIETIVDVINFEENKPIPPRKPILEKIQNAQTKLIKNTQITPDLNVSNAVYDTADDNINAVENDDAVYGVNDDIIDKADALKVYDTYDTIEYIDVVDNAGKSDNTDVVENDDLADNFEKSDSDNKSDNADTVTDKGDNADVADNADKSDNAIAENIVENVDTKDDIENIGVENVSKNAVNNIDNETYVEETSENVIESINTENVVVDDTNVDNSEVCNKSVKNFDAEIYDGIENPSTSLTLSKEPLKKNLNFDDFINVINFVFEGNYSRSFYLKIANIMILAFKKFDDTNQRKELKNSMRKLIFVLRYTT